MRARFENLDCLEIDTWAFDTTMGLVEADLGPGVRASAFPDGNTSNARLRTTF